MQERLQKIIARAGIASRRHAEKLILSGQVRVNGRVVTELGTKADPATDRIEAAGRVVREEERKVWLLLNKPPGVVSTLADPEGRRTLRHCLRGFRARVYPVGRLDYAASGLVFLTNDGDLADEMLHAWDHLPQTYFFKVKGRLSGELLKEVATSGGISVKPVRLPDASRSARSNRGKRGTNFWYEATLHDSRRDALRRLLFAKEHPVEKMKRVALGPFTVEGLPEGLYRELSEKEVEALRRALHFKSGRKAGIAFRDRPDFIGVNAAVDQPAKSRRNSHDSAGPAAEER